jgi:hypothetical protein
VLLNLVLAGTLAMTGVQPVESVWLTKYRALEAQISGNYYTSPKSDRLAWGESYIMRSYLDVYQATQDSSWLDKLVTHADTVIANADDIDGDGFLGWSTAKYTPVALSNPDFTNPTGSDTLPTAWTRFQDTGSHIYRTTDTPAGEGPQAVRVVSDQTRWKKLYQNVAAGYGSGVTYVLRGWGKKTGSTTGRIVLREGTRSICALDYTSTSWTYKEVECVMPRGGPALRVWLEHASYTAAGSTYFDAVELSGRYPFIVHDGMIGLPMAEFARLVATTPALSAYAGKAEAYRAFLETQIVPRWERSAFLGNTWNGTTYREPPNINTMPGTDPSRDLPYNMALVFANMLTVLHSLNGDAAYQARADSVVRWAKGALTNSGGAYVWNYASYSAIQKEDISHANVDLSAFLEYYRNGRILTAADMTALKNTFKNKVWNGSTTAPRFRFYVDGSDNTTQADIYLHSWIELTEWDPQVKALVATKYTNLPLSNPSHLITLARLIKHG